MEKNKPKTKILWLHTCDFRIFQTGSVHRWQGHLGGWLEKRERERVENCCRRYVTTQLGSAFLMFPSRDAA